MSLLPGVAQLLVVSDQEEAALLWIHCLSQRSLRATAATLDAAPSQILSRDAYALIVLDIQDDASRALAICRYARATFAGPILFFTYEVDERFHLEAYRAGIDECIAKPIGISLAVAKVVSWLRRTPPSPAYRHGVEPVHFQIDRMRRLLTTPEGKIARLSKLECRLLSLLLDNRGQIMPSERMVAQLWAGNSTMSGRRLKNLVHRLRRKIEPDPDQPRYLRTVPGYGYCFDTETRPVSR
jgi:DNA-binding response OmpR family regulator